MKFLSILSRVLLCLVEDILRPWSGPLGILLRRIYYRRRLRNCGERLIIGPDVHITSPAWISLGTDVWIDHGCSLIAGPPEHRSKPGAPLTVRNISPGEVVIGDAAHIGIGAIIQGHGGVHIGDGFTLAPHAKIYSYSNDYRRCRGGTVAHEGYRPSYRVTPVCIGHNVWVGLNAVIVGHSVGDNCFIRPGSVVAANIEENSVVSGDPAEKIGARFLDTTHSDRSVL
jgi:UDP-2-acetamido-3-amino-2,3-dideoxy-glucuronate N-acetyltransferase